MTDRWHYHRVTHQGLAAVEDEEALGYTVKRKATKRLPFLDNHFRADRFIETRLSRTGRENIGLLLLVVGSVGLIWRIARGG